MCDCFSLGFFGSGAAPKKYCHARNVPSAMSAVPKVAFTMKRCMEGWIGPVGSDGGSEGPKITRALRPMNPPMKKSAVLRRGAARLAAMSKPKIRISGLAQIAIPMDAPTSMA